MTLEDYEKFVMDACQGNDTKALKMIARGLWEAQEAKQLMRDAGYGVMGTPIIDTTRELLDDLSLHKLLDQINTLKARKVLD